MRYADNLADLDQLELAFKAHSFGGDGKSMSKCVLGAEAALLCLCPCHGRDLTTDRRDADSVCCAERGSCVAWTCRATRRWRW